jgi:hypothetical protein
MWVNPQNSDEGTPLISRNDWTIDNFTKLSNRAGNGSGQATLSNLNVATTWNDVVVAVPEPSAFLFGGLVCGVLGVNYARKRKST